MHTGAQLLTPSPTPDDVCEGAPTFSSLLPSPPLPCIHHFPLPSRDNGRQSRAIKHEMGKRERREREREREIVCDSALSLPLFPPLQ